MELSKSSYIEVLAMPILNFRKYIEWKIKHDNDREKQKSNALSKLK